MMVRNACPDDSDYNSAAKLQRKRRKEWVKYIK
jgi:hypothetical protein